MGDTELIARIAGSTDLSQAEADRVIEDVLAFYREPLVEFVRRRHHQLRDLGARNEQIWDVISAEMSTRLFEAPPTTHRQLRRLVYG